MAVEMLDASDWIENGVTLKEYLFCSLKVLWSQNILLGKKKKTLKTQQFKKSSYKVGQRDE